MQQLLKEIMSDVLNLKITEISDTISLKTCDQWDSLKHMELMSSLEDNFDIEPLSLDEIVTMTSYEAIVKVLQSKVSN